MKEIVGGTIAGNIIFTGEIITANKEQELRVINGIKENAFEGAVSLVNTLLSKSKLALATAKRIINHKSIHGDEIYLDHTFHEFALLFDYLDSVKGTGAYLEKRKPNY